MIRVDWDPGFEEGRQFGRGKSGGQVRDDYRKYDDPGRVGPSKPYNKPYENRGRDNNYRRDDRRDDRSYDRRDNRYNNYNNHRHHSHHSYHNHHHSRDHYHSRDRDRERERDRERDIYNKVRRKKLLGWFRLDVQLNLISKYWSYALTVLCIAL